MAELKPEEMIHYPPMDQLQGFQYCIDSNSSWGEAITLKFQHYILSLGIAVRIPTMLVLLVGGNDIANKIFPAVQRVIILRDASSYEIKLTFWGQRVTESDADSVYEAGQIEPITAFFVDLLMKIYGH